MHTVLFEKDIQYRWVIENTHGCYHSEDSSSVQV